MKKRIFATLLAAVMTIASTMTAFAAEDTVENITSIEVEIDVTDLGGTDNTLWVNYQANDTGWDNGYVQIDGIGKYTLKTEGTGLAAINGLGYFWYNDDVVTGDVSGFKYTISSFKINGVEMTFDVWVPTDRLLTDWTNGLPNMWGSDEAGTKICSGEGYYVIKNENGTLSLYKEAQAPGTTPAPETTPTPETTPDTEAPDTADVAPVVALVAVAAVAAAVVLKKRTVTE